MARSNGGFLADFQAFLAQGNVVELAVAVVIGGAFGKIISSFVEDIITPAILTPALKAAKVDDLKNLSWDGIKYGSFLAAVINFIVIALCIFVLIRVLEKAKRKTDRQEAIASEAAVDPAITAQERLTGAVERLTSTIENRGA